MPLAHIEIEQTERDRWVGRVEATDQVGISRGTDVRANSFDDVIDGVIDAYFAIVPKAEVPKVVVYESPDAEMSEVSYPTNFNRDERRRAPVLRPALRR